MPKHGDVIRITFIHRRQNTAHTTRNSQRWTVEDTRSQERGRFSRMRANLGAYPVQSDHGSDPIGKRLSPF